MSEINKLVESLKSSGPSFNQDGIPVGRFPNYKESWAAAFIIEQLQYRLDENKLICDMAVELLKDSTGIIKLRQNQEKIKEVIEKYEKSKERDTK